MRKKRGELHFKLRNSMPKAKSRKKLRSFRQMKFKLETMKEKEDMRGHVTQGFIISLRRVQTIRK